MSVLLRPRFARHPELDSGSPRGLSVQSGLLFAAICYAIYAVGKVILRLQIKSAMTYVYV